MAGFYRGAVGDWFRDAAVAMVTEAEPKVDPYKEVEQPTYRDAIEDPVHADFDLISRMSMIPCGCCGCPGCYDCTPDADEPCTCAPAAGEVSA